MDLSIFFIVVLAAFLHATWNVLVKTHDDRLVGLTILQTLMGVMGIVMLLWFGLPSSEAYGYALASGILHTGYNLFLVRAYKTADLSQVYPIARGTAPLLTLVGTYFLLHDNTSIMLAIAIFILVTGLLLTGLGPRNAAAHDPHALFYALGTAAFIASYTLVDGMGARKSANAFGYAGLLFVLDGMFLLIAGFLQRGRGFALAMLPHWRRGMLGALASGAAYALVIWAMTKAPIASVAALRETSIVFVMILSARVLNEALNWQRVGGCLLILVGAALLRFA